MTTSGPGVNTKNLIGRTEGPERAVLKSDRLVDRATYQRHNPISGSIIQQEGQGSSPDVGETSAHEKMDK